ncbi:MAG: tetratricopeptide repeat protein, partial [Nitrospinales bacterium]
PKFDSLISVVPFGIPRREPKKGKNIFRGKIPGIGPKDFLIVWGGTLAHWFDCQTPVRALARLKKCCPRAKLVFTASKHPVTAEVPEAHQKVINLARKKGVLNKSVFFSPGWIPYDQHEYYLTEADAGIVTFHDHIENRFSFRIRMVNYLWGNLPILSNPGNVMSDLIAEKNLGKIFAFGDDKALADQIEWMVTHPSALKKIRRNIAEEKKRFHWEKVLAPLIRFCRSAEKSRTLFSNGRLCDREILEERPGFSPDRLARLVPSHPYLRLSLAKKHFAEGRMQEASKLIQEHMRLFGDGLDTEMFRLPIFDVESDFSLEDLLKLVPDHPHARLMQAKIKMNQNRLDEALRLIEEEARLFGCGAETDFFRGLLCQRLGEHKIAVKNFERVRRELPNRIECWLPLAESLNHLGQKDRARRLYAQVWKQAEKEADKWVRERVAVAMAKLEAPIRSEAETLDYYLEHDPENQALLYAKASALEKAGNNREAGALFQKLATSSPSERIRGAAWFRLARLSPKDRQKRMLKECLKFDPAHGGAKKLLQGLSENLKTG